ncbi:hypothetical protein [Renibacterium salmoninarum]|nr:hypothetical protein [Renibacterium salmoninarum]
MNEITNPVELAQHNLDEADRQLRKAQADLALGDIDENRLRQFEKLRDICAEDFHRVVREN